MNITSTVIQTDPAHQQSNSPFPQKQNNLIQIKHVKTIRDLKKFVKFPYRLYANNSCWVPPLFISEMDTLRWDKNLAFENCQAAYWLAYKDGVIVGRIAGIISHAFIEKWGMKNARFGWIDFIDDYEV